MCFGVLTARREGDYHRRTMQDSSHAASRGARLEQKPVTPASGARDSGNYPHAYSIPFPDPGAAFRLVIFPHAGSGTAYYHFLAKSFAGAGIETLTAAYPGREIRISEPPRGTLPELIDALAPSLAGVLSDGKPFVFYGHSMGALVGFELIRLWQAKGLSGPALLVCSGRQAPSIRGDILNLDALSDDAFMDAIATRYQAIPREVVQHPELVELILPALRSDFRIVDRYGYRPGPPVPCPIALANGVDDPWVAKNTLAPWANETAVLTSQWFPGGHFFVRNSLKAFREYLLASCRQSGLILNG